MDARTVTKVAVVGAGVMGSSIALVHARAGMEVALVDVNARLLDRARNIIQSGLQTLAEHGALSGNDIPTILARVHPSTDLAGSLAGVEFVEEAVPEVPDIKKPVLSQLDALLPPHAVIASNTSGLDIYSFAEVTRPDRLVIAHYFVPAHIVPLVEVVPGPLTSPETVRSTVALMERMGKKAIAMKGFIRSFIVNNIQQGIASAVVNLLNSGLVTADDIDRAVKYSLGVRLPVVGVVQSLDFNGLDLILDIRRGLNQEFSAVEELVAEGHLGVKSGRGFYDYGGRSEVEILKKRDAMFLRLLDQLAGMDAFEPV